MKNEAVVKINKMGTFGLVVSRIWFIFVCIGLVGCLLGMVGTVFLPNNFIQVQMDGSAVMNVNIPESWGSGLEHKTNEEFQEAFAGKFIAGDDGASVSLTEASLEGNTIKLSGNGELYTFDFGKIRYAIVFAMINIIVVGVTAFLACRLCKSVRDCETPFAEGVIRNIQYVAYSLIPWCLMDSASGAVPAILFHTGEIGFSINFSKLFICLIILAIAYIFKYGAKLQQEADETL